MTKVKFKNIGARGSFNPATEPRYSAMVPFSQPEYVEWLQQNSPENGDFFFRFDEQLIKGLDGSGNNLGYLFESRPYLDGPHVWGWIVPHILKNLQDYKDSYKYIFTSWKDLVELGSPFAYRIGGGSKLDKRQRQIYPKNKLVSMFVSNSNILYGHKKRLEYKNKYAKYMDVYGRGFTYLPDVDYIKGYKDYRFVVTFENAQTDWQFSEKLLDPILTGAVPIYYGSHEVIEKYFDSRGILFANEIDPSKDLSIELYESMMPYIIDNFNAALKLPTIEDYIYLNYLKEQL